MTTKPQFRTAMFLACLTLAVTWGNAGAVIGGVAGRRRRRQHQGQPTLNSGTIDP